MCKQKPSTLSLLCTLWLVYECAFLSTILASSVPSNYYGCAGCIVEDKCPQVNGVYGAFPCPLGYYSVGFSTSFGSACQFTTLSDCYPCPENTYVGDGQCQPCPSGQVSPQQSPDSSFCTLSCGQGMYRNSKNSNCESFCHISYRNGLLNGFLSSPAVCQNDVPIINYSQPCGYGQIPVPQQVSILFTDISVSCVPCHAGTGINMATGLTCDMCPANTYSSDGKRCIDCPRYTNTGGVGGRTSAGDCKLDDPVAIQNSNTGSYDCPTGTLWSNTTNAVTGLYYCTCAVYYGSFSSTVQSQMRIIDKADFNFGITNQPFSIVAWLRHMPGSDTYETVASTKGLFTDGYMYLRFTKNNILECGWKGPTDVNEMRIAASSASDSLSSDWTLWSCVYDPNTRYNPFNNSTFNQFLYKNGRLIKSGYASSGYTADAWTSRFTIGSLWGIYDFFNGKINSVSMYNRAVSSWEITNWSYGGSVNQNMNRVAGFEFSSTQGLTALDGHQWIFPNAVARFGEYDEWCRYCNKLGQCNTAVTGSGAQGISYLGCASPDSWNYVVDNPVSATGLDGACTPSLTHVPSIMDCDAYRRIRTSDGLPPLVSCVQCPVGQHNSYIWNGNCV